MKLLKWIRHNQSSRWLPNLTCYMEDSYYKEGDCEIREMTSTEGPTGILAERMQVPSENVLLKSNLAFSDALLCILWRFTYVFSVFRSEVISNLFRYYLVGPRIINYCLTFFVEITPYLFRSVMSFVERWSNYNIIIKL